MTLWFQSNDAKRSSVWDNGRCWLNLFIGTADRDLDVWAGYNLMCSDGSTVVAFTRATRNSSDGRNGYWLAKIGPFSIGDRVEYFAIAQFANGEISSPTSSICIGQPRGFRQSAPFELMEDEK